VEQSQKFKRPLAESAIAHTLAAPVPDVCGQSGTAVGAPVLARILVRGRDTVLRLSAHPTLLKASGFFGGIFNTSGKSV